MQAIPCELRRVAAVAPIVPRARWRGVALDDLSAAELATTALTVIALDRDGRVVAMSPSAATWAGVSAWQARGRGLVQELAWRFGAAATGRIAEFITSTAATAALRTSGQRRGQSTTTDAALLRGLDRIYLALA